MESDLLPDQGQAEPLQAQVDRLEELFTQEVFNLDRGILYYPVRHHSPACSRHLLEVFRDYKPDIVLVEGPESGNPLIPVLADEATRTPVSLYYAYNNGDERAACYYPMLDYSPEYTAIKEAAERRIPAWFIDLDYRLNPESSREGMVSYQDETLLAGSSFIARLCGKLNCRSFDELWEKVFEIGSLDKTPAAFAREVFTYCSLSRMCYSEERLRQEGDLAREAHMRERIQEASAQYERVLVVTGGFHTYGLLEQNAAKRDLEDARQREQQMQAADKQIYPMVYTFTEADRLNGYASGMPYVNYYDQVWKLLRRGPQAVYNRTATAFLTRLLRSLRKGHGAVSTTDAIEAYSMIQGLAVLRGKREGGVYELLDAVTSAFVKGEHTLAADRPLEELQRLLTGDRIGEVAPNEFAVPLVEDFKAQSAVSKLQLRLTGKHKKVLELYGKPVHRRTSQLLHCADFLGTGFARLENGPDWVHGRNLNLVREHWTYTYSSLTEARLIEASIFGGTVQEAAVAKVEQAVRELPGHHSREAAQWLLRALLMGLEELADNLVGLVKRSLRLDGSFLSLCGTLTILGRIHEHRRLFGLAEGHQLLHLQEEAYDNALGKMDALRKTLPEEHTEIVQALKLLAMLAEAPEGSFSREGFCDALQALLAQRSLAPQLEGVCITLLVRLGQRDRLEIAARGRSYMQGAPNQAKHTAPYLQGVFTAGREAFLYDSTLLSDLNLLLQELSPDDFMQMIPELRLAFTFFTPVETELIAQRVAGLYQVDTGELQRSGIDEQELRRAKALDQSIRKEFALWKLI
ncbi:hypothetical protein B9T62_12070 [Paenibacillus donghaensis]|uniref:4-aminobutyrate aminotransferase n=2 Tax=Paenibacillus donghaensis TaxID=414771 RepID=A0A2Z2KR02_9BACL|nr:hypothetical protein B9T62_12070 [Paenibacillus donghaensis]